jgi:hypothetical protein
MFSEALFDGESLAALFAFKFVIRHLYISFVKPATILSLQALRAELAHHFEEEESGGCMEEAVSHEPHLGPEATRLVREHPELLAQMDRLIKGLRALVRLTASADEVEQDFRNFTEKLLAHEAAENRVLKEGFGIDVE